MATRDSYQNTDDAYSDETKKASSDSQVEPSVLQAASFAVQDPPPQYRLYKRRWAGLVALVRTLYVQRPIQSHSSQFFLNIISGASWPWFGSITIPSAGARVAIARSSHTPPSGRPLRFLDDRGQLARERRVSSLPAGLHLCVPCRFLGATHANRSLPGVPFLCRKFGVRNTVRAFTRVLQFAH